MTSERKTIPARNLVLGVVGFALPGLSLFVMFFVLSIYSVEILAVFLVVVAVIALTQREFRPLGIGMLVGVIPFVAVYVWFAIDSGFGSLDLFG